MGKAAAEIIIKNLKSSRNDDAKEITFLNTAVLATEFTQK
ncbi:hypothetical protein SAMN06265220_1156 [Flavobacterium nitrogenifigens]|uniref:LacI family transcriptional regulator n=1 Tax=Flavobacterium nitrogenifigens TaxID=1617283 RepID=A0A521FI50_9FLAO|nr:hypothetical protein SAMN06265220_1156 [Flavobacterium nitrogenifigens]